MKFHAFFTLVFFIPIFLFAQNHLLISEIQVNPRSQQFIEIYNPNSTAVDLSHYYLADYNTYYQLVQGTFSTDSKQFLVKFPDGASIDPAAVRVVAFDGTAFQGTADWEILSTSNTVSDMNPIYVGSQAQLEPFDLVILFYWDGQSDLVKDVDYVMWGSFRSKFIDKSGVAIDGPDADSQTSSYLPDTPTSKQSFFVTVPGDGKSMERINFFESGETQSGGNGITGHDETSEPIAQNFIEQANPNPGVGPGQVGAPLISDIVQTPEKPTLLDSVTIEATIIDNGTVTAARVIYSVDQTAIDSSDMKTISETRFQGLIPPQPPNSVVKYFIRAIDDQGLRSTSDTLQYIVADTARGGPHLLISEIVVMPSDGEFVEIFNPTQHTIDLSDYYLTDATYAAGGAFYYNIVTGQNAGGGAFGDFHARFPDGATIAPGEAQTIAMNGSGFASQYQMQPTYELYDTDPRIPDMREALPGSINNQGGLSNTGEVVILYYWDGQSDLVQDVDYVVWGDKAEAVDKTGVSIDGPDSDNIPSTYKADTPIDQQISVSSAEPHANGESIQRANSVETDERQTDGNGLTGHDETSENLAASFQAGTPNPGVGPAVLGAPQISNVTRSPIQPGPDDVVTVSATITDDGFIVSAYLFYALNSNPFDSTAMSATANNVYEAQIPAQPQGTTVKYYIKAVDNDGIVSLSPTFSYTITGPVQIIPISQIQINESTYLGQQVTIEGIVVLGSGITTTGWTDAYVQDNSNYGINIFRSGELDPNLQRGNKVRITGTVDNFNGVTEIVNYTSTVISTDNPLPPPVKLSTREATNLDLEGTFVQVQGEITDMGTAGSGTNITVDDGSGPMLIRVWNSTGVSLAAFSVGDTIVARGPLDIFSNATQLLVGYQEDIFKVGGGVAGDGSGFSRLNLQNVNPGTQNLNVKLSLWSNEKDTLRTIHFYPPFNWQWSGLAEDVHLSGNGFRNAKLKVTQEYDILRIEITDASVTRQDSGYVTISGMTSAPDSAISYFWVKTAVRGGVPQFIAESPSVVVGNNAPFQIFDIQFNPTQFTQPVTIRGVVTVGAGVIRTDRTSAYVQDKSGRGININQGGAPDTTHFQRNYLVEVTGSVTEFQQTTEIVPSSVTVLATSAVPPQPIQITTGEANHPRWDGTLVQVRGVVTDKFTTSQSPPFDYNVVVNDGSGGITLRIWGTTGIDVSFFDVNDALIARGVGGVFIDQQGKANYQILPAYQDQIELDRSYQPSLEGVSLEVPPHPFVPDRNETISIRYNAGAVNNHVTIRIFDLGGRLVTTLLDEDARVIVNTITWNGRNELLDLVPLGTYICHLEVVEPVSGKKLVRTAPIVVGTVLNKKGF